jgi:hypothetical protein
VKKNSTDYPQHATGLAISGKHRMAAIHHSVKTMA